MSVYITPLQPVADALYGVLLQDAALTALLSSTGVVDDIPQDPSYPFLWVEVQEPQQWGGFGTKPGIGVLPEIGIRLHVYSQFQGMAEAYGILTRAITLLADPPAVVGFSSWAIFHDTTITLPDEALNGVKVKEVVGVLRLYVEEQ